MNEVDAEVFSDEIMETAGTMANSVLNTMKDYALRRFNGDEMQASLALMVAVGMLVDANIRASERIGGEVKEAWEGIFKIYTETDGVPAEATTE